MTGIEGGIAENVIPDSVRCTLDFRFAPGRTADDAERELRSLVGRDARFDRLEVSPSAPVALDAPLVQRLRRAGDLPVEPKQAWTPVAEFAAHGLDAVNLGPGAPRYAHRPDEQVSVDSLVRTFETLRRFLAGTV